MIRLSADLILLDSRFLWSRSRRVTGLLSAF